VLVVSVDRHRLFPASCCCRVTFYALVVAIPLVFEAQIGSGETSLLKG
jgi:hypothetical protein